MKVYSPMTGNVVNLDDVQDEMFSQRMLGDGVALSPQANSIYSPIDGEVTMIYETQHAIGIKTESNLEILLHIGLETVMLSGIPFDTQVRVGDRVKTGDLLTVVDWDYIKNNDCDAIVLMLAIDKKVKLLKQSGLVQVSDAVFEVEE